MPLILSGNVASATADAGYTVDNSCRFNEGSTDYLNTTFGTSTSTQKCTYSVWVKRSKLKDFGGQYLLVYNNVGDAIYFNGAGTGVGSNDQLVVYSGSDIQLYTNRLFRDTSAWYHIVVAVDTTQATDTNRVKLYINGTQETSFATETYPAQNFNFDDLFSSSGVHEIGRGSATGTSEYFAGYMSEAVFIDGTQYAASDFGEFDSDSPTIWKPIDVSGLTFGTNGFYLDFKDSAALGDDVSGNSNDFTVNNLTSVDQATDTPTNNFATFNPLNPEGSITYSEGNLKINNSADASYRVAHSTLAVSNGKWYAEFKADNMALSVDSNVGIISADQIVYSTGSKNTDTYIGGWSYGASGRVSKYNNTAQTSQTTFTTGDIIGVALDIDNGYLYFAKNNTWQNSGDPTSGATGTGGYALANQTDFYYFIASTISAGGEHRWLANFGSPPYSITSGNADANGYGNMEYAFPDTDYYCLCTKNLAEFG